MLQESQSSKAKVAICAIFKNESPYILEWISHHKLIGVTDFFIADNISTDGSSEILKSLHNNGEITLISWPTQPGVKPQLPAYEKLAKMAKESQIEWALFIDADEFVVLSDKHSNINSAISEITKNDNCISGVIINWSTYGSSNIIVNSDHSVLKNFEFRFNKESNINKHYKSMIKIDSFLSSGSTPHEFKLKDSCKYVNTSGQKISQPLTGLSESVIWDNLKIHHYMIKSKCEYVSNKMRKGRASSATNLDLSYFHAHDVNREHAPMEMSWLKSVDYLKEELVEKYDLYIEEKRTQLYLKKKNDHIGAIDIIKNKSENQIEIIGWAIGDNGKSPGYFRVIANHHNELVINKITPLSRHDVLESVSICNEKFCGFSIICEKVKYDEIDNISVYFGSNPIVATGLITSKIS